MNFAQAFGITLKAVRLQLGLSQEAFLGVAAISTISRIERGLLAPSVPLIEEIASILRVDSLVLLTLAAARRDGMETGGAVISRIESGLRNLGRLTSD